MITAFETGQRRSYPRDRTIHEQLALWARRTPDAPALQFGEKTLSYRQLAVCARRVGELLREYGIKRGSIVAVLDQPSVRMVATLAGILHAGATLLPLAVANPAERNRAMVRDARADVVLVADMHAESFADAVPISVLDPLLEAPVLPAESIAALEGGHPLDVAYILYTSGSTGVPKGVMIPHRAITRLVVNTDYLSLGPSDVIAQVTNVAFDAAILEIWGALLNGAKLVGLSRDQMMIPEELSSFLAAHQVSTMFLTTSLFHLHAAEAPDVFHGLRNLLVGGEVMDPAAARAVLAAGPPRKLVNGYGPTEATVFSTGQILTSEVAMADAIPIGRPIANTDVRILAAAKPVTLDEPGELYIGGDGLALGYVNQPKLTAERFIADPHRCGGRLYRTGDLGRWRPDGTIDFLGRMDRQVKIRGFRIELDEVEAAMRRHPAVADAVVRTHGEAATRRLVGFIVTDRPAVADDVTRFLAMRLPPYMVPAVIVSLTSFPLTANGKVDRAALQPPAGARIPSSDA